MSVFNKKWKIKNQDQAKTLKEKLLENRGLKSEEEITQFLEINETEGLCDPFLMKDMKKATDRIIKAIQNQEKIIVFGDYDVDGVSGSAILIRALSDFGAKVSYRIPHRVEDGYGLNMKFIEEFDKIGVDLIITVDCGISCKDQVARAAELGMDVIITDHHNIPEEEPKEAVAIVHPLQETCPYPYKGLTGAGVAFKLAQALIMLRAPKEQQQGMIDALLDLASLGTVADCGPLLGENRYIVKKGLKVLRNTKWPGLSFLMQKAGLKDLKQLDTTSIGFRIAPRINAAGRISSALYPLQLLIHDEATEKTVKLADKLEEINTQRRALMEKALYEAQANIKVGDDNIVIGWHKDWHVGVLGLIAGRLAESHGMPAMIMQDFGEYLVASARSNESFNIVEALTEHKDLLDHFGGHHQAAGFNIKKENLKEFVKKMKLYAKEKLANVDLRPTLKIDCELGPNEVSWDTLKLLETLEPFGVGNEKPTFLIKDLRIENVRQVGSERRHLSFVAQTPEGEVKVIGFKMGEFIDHARKHGKIDLACHLQKNFWNGRTELQLQALDFRSG